MAPKASFLGFRGFLSLLAPHPGQVEFPAGQATLNFCSLAHYAKPQTSHISIQSQRASWIFSSPVSVIGWLKEPRYNLCILKNLALIFKFFISIHVNLLYPEPSLFFFDVPLAIVLASRALSSQSERPRMIISLNLHVQCMYG